MKKKILLKGYPVVGRNDFSWNSGVPGHTHVVYHNVILKKEVAESG